MNEGVPKMPAEAAETELSMEARIERAQEKLAYLKEFDRPEEAATEPGLDKATWDELNKIADALKRDLDQIPWNVRVENGLPWNPRDEMDKKVQAGGATNDNRPPLAEVS